MISIPPVSFGMAAIPATVQSGDVGLRGWLKAFFSDVYAQGSFQDAGVSAVRKAPFQIHEPQPLQEEPLTFLLRRPRWPFSRTRLAIVLTGDEAVIAKQRYGDKRSLPPRTVRDIRNRAAWEGTIRETRPEPALRADGRPDLKLVVGGQVNGQGSAFSVPAAGR